MQKEIKHTWFYSQSPQDVWDYLTKSELLEQWLMPNDFQPVVGHKFQFFCNNTCFCEVLEVEPCTKLTYTWQTNSVETKKPFVSKVMWTLLPKENGTELQLVHNGFTALEDLIMHENGWNKCAEKLEGLVNKVEK